MINWILCSKRLPKSGEKVLLKLYDGINTNFYLALYIYNTDSSICGFITSSLGIIEAKDDIIDNIGSTYLWWAELENI